MGPNQHVLSILNLLVILMNSFFYFLMNRFLNFSYFVKSLPIQYSFRLVPPNIVTIPIDLSIQSIFNKWCCYIEVFLFFLSIIYVHFPSTDIIFSIKRVVMPFFQCYGTDPLHMVSQAFHVHLIITMDSSFV